MPQACKDCSFAVNPDEQAGGISSVRECHRYPPSPTVNPAVTWKMTEWPLVLDNDWCGEFLAARGRRRSFPSPGEEF